MEDETYETLKKRISESLSVRRGGLAKCVGEISRNFGNLGLQTAVWIPEKIHSTNLGGIDADSYFGYSRIEGRWGLIIRTIERDHDSGAFVSQRVFTMESCGNVEIVVNALKKVRELMRHVSETADQQIGILSKLGGEFDPLRNPECRF